MGCRVFAQGRRARVGIGLLGLWFALVSTAVWAVGPVDPSLQVSAETPVQEHALPKAEFDAIVAEAKAVAERPRKGFVQPLPTQWRTLDPARMSALLRMPAFAQIPESTRGVLLDQAATWDQLSFRRPSDAAVLWERVWPRASYADPNDAPNNSTGIIYEPDPTWSPTSMALSTIFACFPTSAWSAQGDALVSALRVGPGWQWRNETGWNGFRECIPDGAFIDETRPNKAGMAAVEAVLKSKFTDELLADGCSRPGPDSCLLLFEALASLDPRNPQLAVILKRLEPAFDLDSPIELPAVTPPKCCNGPSPADLRALQVSETEALRRNIFLTHKLPVLLREPTAWPAGELERTLAQAMRYTVLLARVQKLEGSRHGIIDRYYNNPWQWIDARVELRVAADQRELGAGYARREACALGELDIDGGTAPFWQGYVAENIRQGNGACERFDRLRLGEVYRAAKGARDQHARELAMQPLQPIAPILMQGGALHELALNDLATTCGNKKVGANDPWHLCADFAARAARQAVEKAAEEQARVAAQPPVDKLACEEGTAARAAEALQYPVGADFWTGWNTACRLDPTHTRHAIIALTYQKGEELTGTAENSESQYESDYDLDVVVMDLKDDTILARRHDDAAITSDAIRFEGLSIDTARYQLAPGKRAFGVRTSHSSHCYQCVYGYSDLTLYLQNGHQLDAVMAMQTSETTDASTESCPDVISDSLTEVSVAKSTSHGLADLQLTTTLRFSSNGDNAVPDACTLESPPPVLAHFDGHVYQRPVGSDHAR